ncbi:vanadium-dependent haloperoxidase [Roseateles violae]|uniref:Vanadium-dependent haloperoxidase n=1 Tax=Roseateles violae TaxID=3058042 RepID=A0ABT8DX93_9BURK|nr:vanadium-dependent haloperoxidase [Pelomonas sp. PFR6]MDN3921317.1 vanadium-dependent haloperoxidase [Pelomonas sp. PFR6]
MALRFRCLALLPALAMIAIDARADAVTDWNIQAFDSFKAAGIGGNPQFRALAILHVAMSDAVNTVQNRYARQVLDGPLEPSASADAAAIAAARGVLSALAPTQKAKLDAAYAAALAPLPEGAARNAGIAIGERAAAAAIADRANDATNAPDTYRPLTAPGSWIPTTPPLFAEYARARPWVLARPDQFRPGPPPALDSAAYARDYNETKELGAAKSTSRTAQQTEAVKFWSQPNLGSVWFEAARQTSAARGLDLADNARLFAWLAMAGANSFIVDWDAKFVYNRWRPITAIRNGDQDGNDATERDAGWTPLNATPMHPEYPSQAAILASTTAGVLQAVFGPGAGPAITVTDNADAKLTRRFDNFAAIVEETRLVRIWGGIHFRSALEASDLMGRQLAAYVVANSLQKPR